MGDLDFTASLAVLTGYTEIRPLPLTYLSVSNLVGHRQQTAPVDCAATLDFVTQMGLQMRKSSTKTRA
jgi:hypothetical protein